MNPPDPALFPHPWNVTPREAVAIQRAAAPLVERADRFGTVRRVAGVDASYKRGVTRAAVAVLSFPELVPLETSVVDRPTDFPYVPGLLTFREAPALLEALAGLSAPPDLVVADGQGLAHPRRLGVASHLGLAADLPVVGCAKSRLCGEYEMPEKEKGSVTPLVDRGETVGAVLRTRTGVSPVFVSTGHRVSLESAVRLVLACCTRWRLTEPVRHAHRAAAQAV